MADFAQKTNIKSAVRKLADPITDVMAFNTIVQSVILNNPFGCVSYMSSGVNHAPVEKSRETYTAKFVYENESAVSVGNGSESYNTIDGFNAGITAIHDPEVDTYSATLKCHDPNGELYFITFSRQQVTISSYEDDSIRARIETWADGVAALA